MFGDGREFRDVLLKLVRFGAGRAEFGGELVATGGRQTMGLVGGGQFLPRAGELGVARGEFVAGLFERLIGDVQDVLEVVAVGEQFAMGAI